MECHTKCGQLGRRASPLLFALVALATASSTCAGDEPAFSVLVAATDAATKQPIAEINVVPASYGDGQVHVTWQSQYRQTLTEASPVFEMQRGWQRTVLRIEAKGYVTVISDPFVKQPGQVLNLELEKGSGIVGTVLQPSGEPADGASIAVCTRTNEVYVENGELRYGGHARHKKLDVTDQTGAFRVPSEPDEWVLVIAHDSGYAERTQPEFSESSQIRLKSWGRVEGRCVVDGQPVAEQQIDIGAGRGDVGGILSYRAASVTDGDGLFSAEKLPPVRLYVSPVFKHEGREHKLLWFSGLVDVKSGEVTRMTVPRLGRRISGKVVLAKRNDQDPARLALEVSASLRPPSFSGLRDHVNEARAAYSAFMQTDFGHAFQRKRIPVAADGTFQIDDLPETAYVLSAVARTKPVGDQNEPGEVVASKAMRITVTPREPDDEILDVGTLVLEVRR